MENVGGDSLPTGETSKKSQGSTFALPSDPCLGECRKRSQQRSQAHVYARTHIHVDLIVVLLCDSDVLYTNCSSVESLLACVNYCGQPDYMCRPDINRISQGTPSRLAYVDFPPKVALLTISGKSHASDHIQREICHLCWTLHSEVSTATIVTEVLHKSQSEPRSWSSKKSLMFPKLDTNRLPHALHPIALLHAWIEISAESSSSFSQLPVLLLQNSSRIQENKEKTMPPSGQFLLHTITSLDHLTIAPFANEIFTSGSAL
ncbi:hypothetical protein TcWFU_003847 [Taenia crassiceps]|uniref:Uncharacterized protein n=1 Tax=Taenia crassiceps TaxID=6207 RepID=A0ABR4Q051_9CEST